MDAFDVLRQRFGILEILFADVANLQTLLRCFSFFNGLVSVSVHVVRLQLVD